MNVVRTDFNVIHRKVCLRLYAFINLSIQSDDHYNVLPNLHTHSLAAHTRRKKVGGKILLNLDIGICRYHGHYRLNGGGGGGGGVPGRNLKRNRVFRIYKSSTPCHQPTNFCIYTATIPYICHGREDVHANYQI